MSLEDAINQASLKLYDDFAPVRAFLREHPELKEGFMKAFSEFATQLYASNFYGPSPHDK